uniref:DUF4806 domain-containing protein n=1 Tax=Anopheles atroparvus TaxID=41427 RepID=A0AAG5D1I5_ANOAO
MNLNYNFTFYSVLQLKMFHPSPHKAEVFPAIQPVAGEKRPPSAIGSEPKKMIRIDASVAEVIRRPALSPALDDTYPGMTSSGVPGKAIRVVPAPPVAVVGMRPDSANGGVPGKAIRVVPAPPVAVVEMRPDSASGGVPAKAIRVVPAPPVSGRVPGKAIRVVPFPAAAVVERRSASTSDEATIWSAVEDIRQRVLKLQVYTEKNYDVLVPTQIISNQDEANIPVMNRNKIANLQDFDDLEKKLADPMFLVEIKEWLDDKIAHLDTKNRIHEAIDYLFTAEFLTRCSWSGAGKMGTKIPFRQYKNVLNLFLLVSKNKYKNSVSE